MRRTYKHLERPLYGVPYHSDPFQLAGKPVTSDFFSANLEIDVIVQAILKYLLILVHLNQQVAQYP